jgi:hexosaminidase
MKRYELWGANYSTAYYGLDADVIQTEDNKGIYWRLETKKDEQKIYVSNDSVQADTVSGFGKIKIKVMNSGSYTATTILSSGEKKSLKQKFSFTKATGKKITIVDPPAPNYPGSGAFTLVNGVITENKLSQSSEWLGFSGKDMDAIIDFGKQDTIKAIKVDVLNQNGSWIYLPSSVEFYTSDNGTDFMLRGAAKPDSTGKWPNERQISISLNNVSCRYVKVVAKNYGIIPSGQPGAGNLAWLFVDEIEVE